MLGCCGTAGLLCGLPSDSQAIFANVRSFPVGASLLAKAFCQAVRMFDLVHIRCCGNGCLGFRPYGGSPFSNAKKVTQNACSYVRPSQARVLSLRDRSGRSGYGLLRCTSFRCVWLRQTVAALPRPDQSLRSAFRRRPWIKIKSTRANAHC